MTIQPGQWMSDQSRLAYSQYLILDSEGEQETRQALLNLSPPPEYLSVYSQTTVSDLAATGPFIFKINNSLKPLLNTLLSAPQRNWGWFASSPNGDLTAIVRHWRERLLSGQRPEQVLYRFHDNRVLSRALTHLPVETLPEYLGPIAGVLYWDGEQWAAAQNPVPGIRPVPSHPAWLNIPIPPSQVRSILHINIGLYLLAEHTVEIVELSGHTNTRHWLTAQLEMAEEWNWTTPDQLHFLITQRLKEEKARVIKSWMPLSGETPQVHYERLYREVEYWEGKN